MCIHSHRFFADWNDLVSESMRQYADRLATSIRQYADRLATSIRQYAEIAVTSMWQYEKLPAEDYAALYGLSNDVYSPSCGSRCMCPQR